ncbi:MAG: hypothetical protein AAF772_18805, partial [Acidobacteriota bacterium]
MLLPAAGGLVALAWITLPPADALAAARPLSIPLVVALGAAGFALRCAAPPERSRASSIARRAGLLLLAVALGLLLGELAVRRPDAALASWTDGRPVTAVVRLVDHPVLRPSMGPGTEPVVTVRARLDRCRWRGQVRRSGRTITLQLPARTAPEIRRLGARLRVRGLLARATPPPRNGPAIVADAAR